VAIACAVEEMRLPLLNSVSEAEEKLSLDRRLKHYDVQLPDPFKIAVFNDFKHSPPLVYLIYSTISYITHQTLISKLLEHINRMKTTVYSTMDMWILC
jgi:hypothetical protein